VGDKKFQRKRRSGEHHTGTRLKASSISSLVRPFLSRKERLCTIGDDLTLGLERNLTALPTSVSLMGCGSNRHGSLFPFCFSWGSSAIAWPAPFSSTRLPASVSSCCSWEITAMGYTLFPFSVYCYGHVLTECPLVFFLQSPPSNEFSATLLAWFCWKTFVKRNSARVKKTATHQQIQFTCLT